MREGGFRPWGALGVLMCAYTVSFVDRTILSLLIPPIQRDLGVSDTQISLLVGFAFAIFYTIMGIPLGRIADRYNRRNLIAFGITFWCLMTAACGLARTYWQLFAARIGVGIGEATLSPAAYSMISDLFPRDQLGRAIATYSMGLPIGSGLALLIGGAAVDLVAGLPPLELPLVGPLKSWQLTFVLVGLPGLAVALMVALMREPERKGSLVIIEHGTAGGRVAADDLMAFLGRNRRVLAHHFGGLAMLVMIVYGATAWIPTLFMRSYGWSATDIGFAYGVIFMVCGTGGLLTGGHLADRWWREGRFDGHLRVVLWSVSTMVPCFILMPFAPSVDVLIGLLALATFTSSLHGGVAGAALQLFTPNEFRGQMTAIYFFIANLIGLGLGPTAVALITDYVFSDPLALGWSIAVLAGIAGPVSGLLLASGLSPYRASVIEFARREGLTAL